MSFLRPRSPRSSAVPSSDAGPARSGGTPTAESTGAILLDVMRAASVAELENAARRLLASWLNATDIAFAAAIDKPANASDNAAEPATDERAGSAHLSAALVVNGKEVS